MSYIDRLRELKYIAPSGSEFTLQFDGLSRTGGKKAPASEFPGQNQGAVQDLGELIGTFPIACYITGADYDTEADRFWDALAETGPGQLIHPRWGNVNVLPTTREQVEEFVDGAGRAVFTITFLKVNAEQFTYPTAVADFPSEVSAGVTKTASAIGDAVPEELTDLNEIASTKTIILASLDTVTTAFNDITGLTDDTRASIAQAVNDITNDIDDLVEAPADLMSALLELYRLPASEEIDIEIKLDSYAAIYPELITGFVNTSEKYGENFGNIAVAIMEALGISAAEATTAGTIATNTQAGVVIDSLSGTIDGIKTDIEEIESAGGFIADYEMQLQADLTTSSAINGLISEALSLPSEQILTLDRELTIIQLVYELYGNLDNLDLIMSYNNLQGDEILLLPRGTVIRWYDA